MDNWISSDILPEKSISNQNFSDKIFLLVGKRKYAGYYNFNRRHFYKANVFTENYIFNDTAVTHWQPFKKHTQSEINGLDNWVN